MAEDTTVADAPAADAPAPVAPAAPKVSLKQPLSEQTEALTKLLANAPERPDAPADVETPKEETVTDEQVEEEEVSEAPADIQEVEEEDEEPQPEPVQLGTWQDYVMSNLPKITTRIKDGEGVKTVQIKSDTELPVGFEFADDSARSQFARDIASQELKAQKLLDEYNQKVAQEQMRQFEVQEAKDVASDLKYLQAHGVVPKFKYADTDSRFNTDPAVKEANAIYDLYKKTNQEYMQKYMGTNRSFRISYRDAADKYYAEQSRNKPATKEEAPKKPLAKTPTDKERDTIASKQGAPQGGEAGTIKPRPFAGMSFDDINRLAKAGKI